MMKELCLEPFFVFQVFCVGLWCLDKYLYYSLFTLSKLFLFESTMAKSRLKTLTELRRVSIAGCSSDDRLSIKRDKSHILFGGTKILQHTPDKTGFETSQGKLMQKILFSAERVTANSWESGLFILFLVFFAIIAAGCVLEKGLEDPTRSKYKLFLSCSLIITSVIPPELPMELSIAVNTSLIASACHGIFCTEPFRIPFAGKVDICCFDKTGTLTSDDMEFQGVAGLADNANLESDK
ncbi:hypothetical protein COCNU_scaffold010657G000020 [Cocos nucifera]|nr:hypothetical protein [Cocos nucifera]